MIEFIYTNLYNISMFVLIISFIVFIHEFGHYFIARKMGVKVEEFSIGMGPSFFSYQAKSGTIWKLCYIPIGGYVKMFGDKTIASTPDNNQIAELTKEEKKFAFHTKSLAAKAAIVAAGPIANYILAIAILAFFYCFFGLSVTTNRVDQVLKDSPALAAGIESGDQITAINSMEVENFSDIQKLLSIYKNQNLKIDIIRNNEQISLNVTPKKIIAKDIFGNEIESSMLGITSSDITFQKLPPHTAIYQGFKESMQISYLTLTAMGQILTGTRSTKELGGPIKIAKYSGASAKKGLAVTFWFIAMLSINLGLINLLPIPMLDGGHLFYYLLEAIRGKPLPQKFQEKGFQLGLFIIILLFVVATFNDIKSLDLFK